MLVALAVLAIVDLVVGVSNDAVNFLNSAIGSKAISVKNIMIIASIGVFFGAVTSSGMMEVARKGIFNPNMFMFQDIMFIFMAVMITDILLLDIFNSLGMPTSTTVSIVFELLGAAVCISLIKISANDAQSFNDIWNYINHETATKIIFGILLSVVVAFSVGAIVQFASRLIYSFNFEKRATYINALFGGFAITAITYFIIIKGMKGTPFYKDIKHLIEGNTLLIIAGSFVVWSLISQFLIKVLKINVLKLIIGIGTFSLAMAFSGNDLVNFVGVPIAAWNSYQAWEVSGVAADAFSMGVLAKKVPSNIWLLLFAGGVMVVTLWTSSKAQNVIKTGIDLSRQGEGHEKFKPNSLSRIVVRTAMIINTGVSYILPKSALDFVDSKFQKPVLAVSKGKNEELPAFDLIRASVNLIVAGILISIATSMKLPLSTTYVTFMVAMGTSLADRAWGSESAVYRVAGVLNVIGGWFLTALSAFLAAAIVAYLISWDMVMIPILLALVIFLIGRNTLIHRKKSSKTLDEDSLSEAESSSVQGVIHESAKNIAKVVKRTNRIYSNSIVGLAKQDLTLLKKSKTQVVKLSEEIDDLRDNITYFIKNLDASSLVASGFYINILGDLQDMSQSLEYISKISYKHINNNHKKLKLSQIKELKVIDDSLETLFNDIEKAFKSESFEKIGSILNEKKAVFDLLNKKIEKQIERTRTEESSPKNTTLHFSLLLETKDLVDATMNLLEEYHNSFDGSVEPATINVTEDK